jgi:O-acetyl-ADP-ribose deacetylase (regulator of RNase III)
MKLVAIHGDITSEDADVIVNAANKSLLGGGGVDGAIHDAAGPELIEECRGLGGCETGDAKITRAYRLPAKWIAHTVGPVWHGGKKDEPNLLRACYLQSMLLADERGAKTIAFPNISTGIYCYPKGMAASLAVGVVQAFAARAKNLAEVRFICFDLENYKLYKKLLA